MNLSISNIGWKTENDGAVYELMKKNGFSGLEIAPTRIFPEAPYEKLNEAHKWAESLFNEYGFSVPSMQSIWYGRQEKIFASEEDRNALLLYTKKAIDFAESIGCKNLVFGCPRNRNVEDGQSSAPAVAFFKELGDYAFSKGTTIGMEANPPIYNTNFINDTLSAIELIEKVDSEGFKLNLDFGTIIQNGEDVNKLVGKVHFINHVHISEPGLKPVETREDHKRLKDILAAEAYKGFISIEMGTVEDINILDEKMKYIRSIF